MLSSLPPNRLQDVLRVYRDALVEHREVINALNVYPVPDGDTGTNMSLTLGSVVDGLPGDDASMSDVCRAIAHGSLMGARGNSGVILSQIMRGLASSFEPVSEVDAECFSVALNSAAKAAYEAVGNPVEGTILTVVRCAAESLDASLAVGPDPTSELVMTVEVAREAAAEALASTPDLLPVLAEAGVVDSGGTGLLLFFDALLNVLAETPIPAPVIPDGIEVSAATTGIEHEHGDVSDLRYEVMFFLETNDDKVDGFKAAWGEVGDSIVVVGGDGIFNCHVHTNDIGAAIECAIDVGRPSKIRVTDLFEEVLALQEPPTYQANTGHTATAVVAVGCGGGVVDLFTSLGVREVVSGGQSMNPSTAEILAVLDGLDADAAIVLPNNKNIVAVADQAAKAASLPTKVIPTVSLVQALSALISFDPESDVDANHDQMSEALDNVAHGEVTQAVRTTTIDEVPVAEGDWLVIASGKIRNSTVKPTDAAREVVAELVDADHEICTVLVGEGVGAELVQELRSDLTRVHPDLEFEFHDGGQPLYPFLIGLE